MHENSDQKAQQLEARRPLIAEGSPLERAKKIIGIQEAAGRLYPGHTIERSCKSPFRVDRNPSFSVYADGRRWKDFGTEEGGDVVDFIARAMNCSTSEAAKILIGWARENAGGPGHSAAAAMPAGPKTPTTPLPLPEVRAMDGAALESWIEGVKHLGEHPQILSKLDMWRGWSAGIGDDLYQAGIVSSPIYHGKRGFAFVVQAPINKDPRSFGLADLGFHIRLQPRYQGDRTMWAYVPSQGDGGCGIPALPFVLGAGFIRQASTICTTEGEWDAVTLASQAGWLDSDTTWPEHIVVFGVRGAGGWRQLIEWWGELWPATARFVIFRDADAAGAKWTAPGNFVDALRQRGHAVRVVCSSNPQEKDLNDLHRASPLSRAELLNFVQL